MPAPNIARRVTSGQNSAIGSRCGRISQSQSGVLVGSSARGSVDFGANDLHSGGVDAAISSMWCPLCQANTEVIQEQKAGPNHVLHAVLSIFFCGLWLPVWIIIAITDSGKRSFVRCTRCRTQLM